MKPPERPMPQIAPGNSSQADDLLLQECGETVAQYGARLLFTELRSRAIAPDRDERTRIYPIFARLVRDGLVRAEWVTGEGPHPRKYYVLTAEGSGQLDLMLKHWEVFGQKILRLAEAAGRRKG